jgi:hypothetical protein
VLQAEVKAEKGWKTRKFLSPQNMAVNLLALKHFTDTHIGKMLSQKRRHGYHFRPTISYAPSAFVCLFPRTSLSKLTTSAENLQKPRDI